MKKNKLEFSIHSSIKNISLVEGFIDQLIEVFKIDKCLKGRVSLSVIEAVNNSILYGNKHDPSKQVKLAAFLSKQKLTITVEDEGQGFDFSKLPDLATLNELMQATGRGLYLMSTLTNELRFANNGAKVIMTFTLPAIDM